LATAEIKFWVGNTRHLYLAIADSTGVSPQVYDYSYGGTEWANVDEGTYHPITIHEVIAVSAGTSELQLLISGGYVARMEYQIYNARMTVMYFPTPYGVKKEELAESVDQVPFQQPILYSDVYNSGTEAWEFQKTRSAEFSPVMALRAEFEAERDALREENAELRRRLEALEALIKN
jgi:hypothetical protein